jgi:UDP-2,4-diacetamido-2,4,6-trideoxy-beta-L-altropyranose hydrolase
MARGSLLIRADALPSIGAGHVMRCLALAEAWQDNGGEVSFITAGISPALEERLRSENMDVLQIVAKPGSMADAVETITAAHGTGASWIVVDGYPFGSRYQEQIRASGFPHLFIDDCGDAGPYTADLILNQNRYAGQAMYTDRDPGTRLLLGTRYSLIRREFLNAALPPLRIPATGRKILVTFGGSDPANLTQQLIAILQRVKIRDLRVIIVVGGINPRYDMLIEATGRLPGFSVLRNVDTMPSLMAWADLAISAGGSTSWELAYLGVPSVLCPVAPNQQQLVEDLRAHGIVQVLSESDLGNPDAAAAMIAGLLDNQANRAELSANMRGLVDGSGPDRIISAMQPARLRLRRARMSDCRRVWEWMNDPIIRANSFTPDPIPLDHHRKWFSRSIVSPDLVYYLALDEQGEPFGQARFHTGSRETVISVLIDNEHRGRGYSKDLIRVATEKFVHETGNNKVHAYIKPENLISEKTFVNAGYADCGFITIQGNNARHFVW